MKIKIFSNVFALSLTVFLATLITVCGVMFSYFSNRLQNNIALEAEYIADMVNLQGAEYLENLESPNLQNIVVTEGGKQVFGEATETRSPDAEILLNSGQSLMVYGRSLGFSDFFINNFLYVILLLAAAVTLSLIIAHRMSKSLIKPISEMDIEHLDDRDVYEELKPLVRRISSQNKQIYSQMQQLKAEHKRQDKMRREFTANVSHELKTPLTSISGYAEIIRDGIAKTEDVPRFAGKIHKESQRLQTLVQDIIHLSELEEGAETTEALVDLGEIADTVCERMSEAAERRKVTLITSGSAQVKGSSHVADELVHNLVDNAIKYNREGGSVEVSITETENAVVLTVTDTGIGIPEEDKEHIFERFYRVNKSRSKEEGGTGLGLSIVKHAALSMGAEISLESRLSEGTKIIVTFKK